jgi:hypothetical protein
MPIGAPQLAIGDRTQANLLLPGDDLLISSSSTALSSAAVICPAACLPRAFLSDAGRNSEPT